MTPEEAINKASETQPLYVKLLKNKRKQYMARFVLREEAMKHLPKASLNDETLDKLEKLLDEMTSDGKSNNN
jgi:hypothetical protein